MNKVLGLCKCPLWYCGESGAEIREGEKGKVYLVCDACGSLLRSPIRKAQVAMRALAVEALPASPPAPAKVPEPAAPPKRKGLGLGFA